MRNNFNQEVRERITERTGLVGEELDIVTSIVYATVFIGVVPSKQDICAYTGVSIHSRTIDKSMLSAIKTCLGEGQDAPTPYKRWMSTDIPLPRPSYAELIYTLAADAVMHGLFISDYDEPVDRLIARTFLSNYFRAQSIQSTEEYVGLNIVLEYLWQVSFVGDVDETGTIEEFVKIRFESAARAMDKVQDFCAKVYECNLHIVEFNSGLAKDILRYLAEGVLGAKQAAIGNGSASIAKDRLSKIIL